MDHSFQGGPKRRTLDYIRDAAALAQQECPEILPALRRQVAVHAMMADLAPNGVISALGGPPKEDARYHLAQARAIETDEQPRHGSATFGRFRQGPSAKNGSPRAAPK